MKSDRVATVRLKMLTIFPDMKRCLKLPRDQTLRTALDTVLRQIIVYDKDTDVQRAAQQVSRVISNARINSLDILTVSIYAKFFLFLLIHYIINLYLLTER